MTQVKRKEDESFESMLKRFRQKVNRGRILSTVRRKRYFTSKSEERRIAQRKAIRRERKRRWREERLG